MNCPRCESPMTVRPTDKYITAVDPPLKIVGVPMLICDECEYEVTTPTVAHQIDALRLSGRVDYEITVPVVRFG